MSLKAFQQVWLELLLNPAARTNFLSSEQFLPGLSVLERKSLQSMSLTELEQFSQRAYARCYQKLAAVMPTRIAQLLGAEHVHGILEAYLGQASLEPLYPRRLLLSSLLNQLSVYLSQQSLIIPHLKDLMAYELALLELDFFQLPTSLAWGGGPKLAPHVRLVRLGKEFPMVLDALNRGFPLPDISETPKQRFLLSREFQNLRLEALPPLISACLEACDGQLSWKMIVRQVLATRAQDSEPEAETLENALEHFLQRGVLIQAAVLDSRVL